MNKIYLKIHFQEDSNSKITDDREKVRRRPIDDYKRFSMHDCSFTIIKNEKSMFISFHETSSQIDFGLLISSSQIEQ